MNKMRVWRASTLAGLVALAFVSNAHAGATVTDLTDTSSATANALANSLLSASSGITIVNGSATYTRAATGSGTFTHGGTGATGLGIDQGVVLSTGDAQFIGSSAAFAGDSANRSDDFTAGVGTSLTANNSGGNALFDSMTAGYGNTNASVLSFSFIPTGNSLTLSFVFGSEDYDNDVGFGFPTDVMGIFVNGVNYARSGHVQRGLRLDDQLRRGWRLLALSRQRAVHRSHRQRTQRGDRSPHADHRRECGQRQHDLLRRGRQLRRHGRLGTDAPGRQHDRRRSGAGITVDARRGPRGDGFPAPPNGAVDRVFVCMHSKSPAAKRV